MNLPNFLSVSRIVFIIPIIIFFENDLFLFSASTFILASITDYLDGYLARKNKQTSDLGAFLDLMADKIFISTLLIWMTFNFDSLTILVSSILIISREISISYLRVFIVSRLGNKVEVKSDLLGKYKTTIQMIGLGFILISPIASDAVFILSLTLLFLSAVLSWYSFFHYLNKWIV